MDRASAQIPHSVPIKKNNYRNKHLNPIMYKPEETQHEPQMYIHIGP